MLILPHRAHHQTCRLLQRQDVNSCTWQGPAEGEDNGVRMYVSDGSRMSRMQQRPDVQVGNLVLVTCCCLDSETNTELEAGNAVQTT